jgi:hypothetical protein
MTGHQCPYCLSYAPKSLNFQLALQRNMAGMCIRCESPQANTQIRLQQHMKPAQQINGVNIE